jgi:hypothetical protein
VSKILILFSSVALISCHQIQYLVLFTLWIDDHPWYVTLTFLGKGQNRTTLLIRSDNLYLIGFNDSEWYAFRGYKLLIPNSIELSFQVDYASLLGCKVGGKWHLT